MAQKEVILSSEGLKRLEDELELLKSVRRREVAERIKQARQFGDINENSEYDSAKNEQAWIEGRIITIEKLLRNARVFDRAECPNDVAGIGCRITIKDLQSGDVHSYTIVGSTEADPMSNKISNESPVGRAVLGQKAGKIVSVAAPVGMLKYQIVGIEY